MKKAWNAIIDTAGHYARPDVVRLQVRGEAGWTLAEQVRALDHGLAAAPSWALTEAAEVHEVEPSATHALAGRALAGLEKERGRQPEVPRDGETSQPVPGG